MNDTTTSPAAAELFHKWKQFLDAGTQTTASFVAADDPAVIPDLQRLIDDYLASHRTAGDSTQTGNAGPAERPQAPNIPGYTVEAFLGGGGMGEVWRVRDPLDRVHALKLVRPDRLSQAGRERFLAEGRSMARLRHPHVVHIHHYDIQGDVPFFLMPAYPASLRDRLPDYQADPAKAARLMARVAAGVGHLHASGLVHRDLKPGNILLDAAGSPVVGDFGLVKSLADGGPSTDPAVPAAGSAETNPTGARRSKTVAGAVLGTRSYMSPEQAGGRTDLANPRWDVWALGVMLHELLTGVLPRSSAAPERLLDPAAPDNPAPAALKPGLDPRLDRIVRRCLARDPEDRYPDAAAVAADLNAWLDRGRRWRTWAAASVGVVLIVGLLFLIFGKHNSDPPAVPTPALISTGPAEPTPESGSTPAGVDAERLDQMRRDLAAGKPATVVGPTGWPVGHKLVIAADRVKPFLSPVDQSFTLDSAGLVFVEFPHPGIDRFRLEAEVCIRSRNQGTHAALCVGRQPVASAKGPAQVWQWLRYGEDAVKSAPNGRTGRWYLDLVAYFEPPGGKQTGMNKVNRPGASFAKKADVNGWPLFRKLAVEVTPAGTVWEWEGGPAGRFSQPLSPNDMAMWQSAITPAPEFLPTAGIGFAVESGQASIRNVTVRALPAD